MSFGAQMRVPARSVAVLSAAALGVAGFATSHATAVGAAQAAASCSAVEVLSARGTGEPQSGSIIMGGLVSAVAQRTGGHVYQVQYPATTDYVNGPNQGAGDALAHLQSQAAACPNQRFVLTGYSEGAMVMTTLMGRIPANIQGRVAAAVLYGNPYFKSGSPAAAGSGKGQANGLVPGQGIPAPFAERTRDYCNAGDPVCGAGSNVAAHLSYSQYDSEAAAFVVKKVQQAGAGGPAPAAPSSAPSANPRPGTAANAVVATPTYAG
jgi:cutinase